MGNNNKPAQSKDAKEQKEENKESKDKSHKADQGGGKTLATQNENGSMDGLWSVSQVSTSEWDSLPNSFYSERPLKKPYSVIVDSNFDFYVADYDSHRVKKISPSGKVTVIAKDCEWCPKPH